MYPHWLITDTHFGHDAMVHYCGRPKDFTERIKAAWYRDVAWNDVVYHLGDIGSKHKDLEDVSALPGHKILIRGNHDKRSYSWYLEHGFSAVMESCLLQVYGQRVLLSHIPQPDLGHYDINIHGHFHNTNFRRHEPHIASILTPKHKLFALEYHGYGPILLRTFLYKVCKEVM